MSDRIVITGGAGQAGRRLAAEAARLGHDVLALNSSQWDITDASAGDAIVEPGDVVVNCAAYTAVDAAEDDAERAHEVNAVGPKNVARACAHAGARLIHLSTDYVFSGRFDDAARPYDIDDPPQPLSVYGHTKLAGERAVRAELPGAQVVRTAWLYTGTGSDFVAAIARRIPGGDAVEVVDDQIGSPTYVGDLAGALLQIASGGISAPLLHAANAGAVSRFELAQAVFAVLGADPQRVRPVDTDRHPRPAPRPSYSALSARLSTTAGLTPLRGWRDALTAALTETG
ncbi:MAG: dTDP-4-dehydrorhamnose reductase [Mycobacteriaceae bacterium]|nr:dTDP-4-dehydrorhamnose reductase [Mycobacteriaceae bacterium]